MTGFPDDKTYDGATTALQRELTALRLANDALVTECGACQTALREEEKESARLRSLYDAAIAGIEDGAAQLRSERDTALARVAELEAQLERMCTEFADASLADEAAMQRKRANAAESALASAQATIAKVRAELTGEERAVLEACKAATVETLSNGWRMLDGASNRLVSASILNLRKESKP